MKTIATTLILFSTLMMNAQTPPKPSVDVSGEGVVSIVPDQVAITVQVENEGDNPSEVQKKNDQTISEVLKYLKKSGIGEKMVQTQHIRLHKNYDYNTKTYSYVANQSLVIKLDDLTKYPTLMNGLLDTGINRIDGINFLSSKQKELEQEARTKAIMNAKTKASEYALALGQSIGKAIHISEFQPSSAPGPMFKAMAMDASQAPTMAVGEMEIRIQVNVSFELL